MSDVEYWLDPSDRCGVIRETVLSILARHWRASTLTPQRIPLKIGLELHLSNLLGAVEYLLDPSDRCLVIRETDLRISGS